MIKKLTLKFYSNGNKIWYLNNKLHREDDPSIEFKNGKKQWWLNGKQVKEEDVIIKVNLTKKEYIKFVMNL